MAVATLCKEMHSNECMGDALIGRALKILSNEVFSEGLRKEAFRSKGGNINSFRGKNTFKG
jgi:hypothetical protein